LDRTAIAEGAVGYLAIVLGDRGMKMVNPEDARVPHRFEGVWMRRFDLADTNSGGSKIVHVTP